MKMRLATGIFVVAAGLFVGRSAAQQIEEIQWLPASPIATRNVQQGSAESIGVGLGEAALLNQTNFSDDPGGVPRQLPSGQGPMAVPPQLEPPMIVPDPSSPKQSPLMGDAIPVPPTEIVGGTVVSSSGCNCGGGAVVSGSLVADGGCGGCGGGCCEADSGWLRPWLSWLWSSHSDDCCCATGGCLDGCCLDGCCYDGNRNHFWFTAEYLVYQFSRPNLPPLVTTGAANTTSNGVVGPALGQPGTTVLVGNDTFDMTRSGMRFGAGFWFPSFDSKLGLDFSVMYFPQVSQQISESSGILGRPYTSASPGTTPFQTTEVVNGFTQNGPPNVNGSVAVDYWNRVWGFDANLRYKLCCSPNFRLDILAGYRNFNVQEGLSVNENLNPGTASALQITDAYNVNNAFNGGQIGVDAEWRFLPRWSVGGQFKLAVGDVHESVNISGSSTVAGVVPPIGVGYFAANTNIGNYSRDQFAVLPEATIKIGFDITKNVRIFVAYDVLFLSNAVRVGDTIDTTINPANNSIFGSPSSPLRPAYNFNSSNFLAQGFTGGLDIHW